MKKLLIIATLFTSAHAEFVDGNKLLADLQSGHSDTRMFALGYIVAISDAGRGAISCPHANVTAGQMNDLVKQYLEITPGLRHHTADVLVNHVLSKAWPCPKRGSV